MDQFNQLLNQYKLPLILSLVGIVLIIGGVFSSGLLTKEKEYPKESIVSKENLSEIKVDVSGAVNKPGVYSLPASGRVEDAIKIAGSFAANANQEYISKSLNLSQKVSDGMKIYVPFEGEVVSGAVIGVASSGKTSLNNATQRELEDLPGVGPVTASKIMSSRPYNEVEELLNKKVVSKSVFEKIKDLIQVN